MCLIKNRRALMQPHSTNEEEFDYKLEGFLNQVVYYTTVLTLPAIAYSIYMAFRHNEMYIIAVDLAVYLALLGLLFYRGLPFRLRAYLFVLLYYILGTFVLHTVGPQGAGLIYLFSFPLFAALLLNGKAALLSIGMVAVSLGGMTLIIWRDSGYSAVDRQIWTVLGLNFIVLEAILTLSISSLFQGLKKTHFRKEKALTEAAASEKRIRLIMDNAFDAMVFCDEEWYLTYYNKGAGDYLYPEKDRAPRNLREILPRIHRDDQDAVRDYFHNFLRGKEDRGIFTFRYRMADQHYRYLEITAIDFRTNPLLNRIVATIRDVTDIRQAEDQAQFYKNHDPVTGFYNERGFKKALEQELIKAAGRREKLALLCLGMDELKRLRPRLSDDDWHHLLQAVGERFQTLFRDDDVMGKLTSDRFLITLTNLNKARDVPDIIAKISREFQAPLSVPGGAFTLSWSAGITLYPEDFTTSSALIRNSETSLDYLRQNRRTGYLFYNQEIYNTLVKQIEMEDSIREALKTRQFRLYYQPKVDGSGQTIGFEALARWIDEQDRFIPPDIFIPIAEQGNLIKELGDYVIREAVFQLRDWLEGGLAPRSVAVNISPAQLNENSFVPWVRRLLESTGVPARLLEFEITERDIQADEARIVATMKELQKLGVRFSIDDFGTGYSSLIRLKEYPVYAVKIDKAFVQDLPVNSESAGIVRSILMLAENLNFKVIAEGIESTKQRDYLHHYNCHFFQGYLFGKPIPEYEVTRLLESWIKS